MSYDGVFQNILRKGYIDSVDYTNQKCVIKLTDRAEVRTFEIPLPQIAMGTDHGLFGHPERFAKILVGWSYAEKPYIVSFLPNSAFGKDLSLSRNASGISVGTYGYPSLEKGEVALSGKFGAKVHLNDSGGVNITSGDSRISIDRKDKILSKTKSLIGLTQSGLTYSGIIFRDLRSSVPTIERDQDKRALPFFSLLSEVGRDPSSRVALLSSNKRLGLGGSLRNPAFVEERKIIKEFADEYQVGTIDEEKSRHNSSLGNSFLSQPNARSNTGYDVLNLNIKNPNNLIESVLGTMVDIYGNLLDINRNVINLNGIQQNRQDPSYLQFLSALTRRSVKLHYELNVKKDATGDVAIDKLDGPDIKNGHNHSRWSIDVDAEGLTKLNIPASSNIGNIPLLSRYINANMEAGNDDVSLNSTNARPTRDIKHLAFGELKGNGIEIPGVYAPTDIAGSGKIKYRTAYHDILNTATEALRGYPLPGDLAQLTFSPDLENLTGTFGDATAASGSSPSPTGAGPLLPGDSYQAIASAISNTLAADGGSYVANAGGRSLFANLDGSMELNIGRDYIDHKSLVLDTSGGIISRIGRMRESSMQASVISQLDGSIFIQVGGDFVKEDVDKVENPKVRLVVIGSKGKDEFVVDEKHVKISTEGGKNIILQSSGDIILNAEGAILLMGKTVGVHGEVDADGNITRGPQRMIAKNGKGI